ncbi:MAG: DUF1491 family protein [Roseibium sp.]
MRVTSDFFVSALVRKIFGEGGFAAVSQKGAAEAGVILIIVDRLDGTFDLYGPAPQAMFSDQPHGRLFEKLLDGTDRACIDQKLNSEKRMDPDFWIVEIESSGGKVDIPLAVEDSEPTEADRLFRLS